MAASVPAPELLFLLRKEKVDDEITKVLVDAGVTSVKTFANLAGDAEAMRKIIADDLKVPTDGLANKVKTATLISAWSAARARSDEVVKVDAIQEVADRPKDPLDGGLGWHARCV